MLSQMCPREGERSRHLPLCQFTIHSSLPQPKQTLLCLLSNPPPSLALEISCLTRLKPTWWGWEGWRVGRRLFVTLKSRRDGSTAEVETWPEEIIWHCALGQRELWGEDRAQKKEKVSVRESVGYPSQRSPWDDPTLPLEFPCFVCVYA